MVTPIPAAKPSEPVKAAEEPVSKENNEAETEPKKKRRKWPWILFFLLFLLAAAAVIVYLLWPRQSPTVSLENLQNATVEEAEEYLLSEDLVAGEVSETYDENFEEGMIIETEPVSGTDVERGSSVDMLVSLGEEPYTMNDHVGDMFEDVKTDLEAAGLLTYNLKLNTVMRHPGQYSNSRLLKGGTDT